MEHKSTWSAALNDLGWRGPQKISDVPELVQHLSKLNVGLPDIKELKVRPTADDAEKASRIFAQYGFVIVESALTAKRLRTLREGVEAVVPALIASAEARVGNRGSHRYSFGQASLTGSLAHVPAWVQLIDLPTLRPVLTRILGAGYTCRSVGGDFSLPGCVDYQELHLDVDRKSTVEYKGETLPILDAPCSVVAVNFLTQDFSSLNGPIRQILTDSSGGPTPTSHERPPSLDGESEESKLSTLLPCAAGAAIIRGIHAVARTRDLRRGTDAGPVIDRDRVQICVRGMVARRTSPTSSAPSPTPSSTPSGTTRPPEPSTPSRCPLTCTNISRPRASGSAHILSRRV
jgi:hypothetical protein